MKRIMTAALAVLCSTVAVNSFAQKFGYINSQELIISMPETDSVNVKMEALSKEWQEQLEVIQVEFNNKVQDYQKTQETLSDAVKQVKEQELNDLSARYQNFSQLAQQDLQQKQQELLQPVIDKATETIKKLGADEGYTIIFDAAAGSMLYNAPNVEDLLPKAKKILGITK